MTHKLPIVYKEFTIKPLPFSLNAPGRNTMKAEAVRLLPFAIEVTHPDGSIETGPNPKIGLYDQVRRINRICTITVEGQVNSEKDIDHLIEDLKIEIDSIEENDDLTDRPYLSKSVTWGYQKA